MKRIKPSVTCTTLDDGTLHFTSRDAECEMDLRVRPEAFRDPRWLRVLDEFFATIERREDTA